MQPVLAHAAAGEVPSRIRFSAHADFATNHGWQEFRVRVALRAGTWEISTSAADEKLRLKYDDAGGTTWARTFSYAELKNPRALAEELGGPVAAALMNQAAPLQQPENLSLGLRWEARNDWLKIGHTRVRAYRLQARLFDRYQAVVVVSRVGEIMQVELPNGILLVNEALTNL